MLPALLKVVDGCYNPLDIFPPITLIQKIIADLNGQKTYLVAFLIGLIAALNHLGMLDPEVVNTALLALGAGGVASLRHGMEKNK